MTMTILDGKKTSNDIKEEIAVEVDVDHVLPFLHADVLHTLGVIDSCCVYQYVYVIDLLENPVYLCMVTHIGLDEVDVGVFVKFFCPCRISDPGAHLCHRLDYAEAYAFAPAKNQNIFIIKI